LTPYLGKRVRRVIRTWQTRFPIFLDAKFALKNNVAKALQRPFERDFNVLKFMSLMQNECMIDVGGNRGQSIQAIKMFHPSAKIFSFEPNSILASRLKEKYKKDLNVSIYNVGLGQENFEGPLYIPFYRKWMFDGLASFDRDSASSWLNQNTIAGFNPNLLHVVETICKVKKLDEFGLSPAFIKIDVQGLEEQVLRGGIDTLTRYKPLLLIEDAHHLGGLLSKFGYREFSFDGLGFNMSSSQKSNSFFATSEMVDRLQKGGLKISKP
jgi:FkbM family methyltransferase